MSETKFPIFAYLYIHRFSWRPIEPGSCYEINICTILKHRPFQGTTPYNAITNNGYYRISVLYRIRSSCIFDAIFFTRSRVQVCACFQISKQIFVKIPGTLLHSRHKSTVNSESRSCFRLSAVTKSSTLHGRNDPSA